MEKKLDCHEALDKFVKDYVAPDSMIYNGTQEQVGPGTTFQFNLRKYVIHGHTAQKEKFQQKPSRRSYSGAAQKMVSINVYNLLSETTMELGIPIHYQDYAIDNQTCWGTTGTNFN